ATRWDQTASPRRAQGRARGVVTTHSVHAPTGRCRRGADEERWVGRAVRVPTRHRPGEELTQVLNAAVDVPTHVVRVVRLELAGRAGVAGQDPIAKPRSEALDLRFNELGHVHPAAVRDVAVGPRRVPTGRRA